MDINALYNEWLQKATCDADLIAELEAIKGNDDEILDRFYRSLEFGTAGLRGVIGAGTNRMNIYTVGRATQGLADFLNKNYENPSVAIGYDSRIKSEYFSREAAEVLAANGIKVYIYDELEPTPCLSYAIRHFHTSSGIILTASHNPAKYNGYKCYNPKGYQMTDEEAEEHHIVVITQPRDGGERLQARRQSRLGNAKVGAREHAPEDCREAEDGEDDDEGDLTIESFKDTPDFVNEKIYVKEIGELSIDQQKELALIYFVKYPDFHFKKSSPADYLISEKYREYSLEHMKEIGITWL